MIFGQVQLPAISVTTVIVATTPAPAGTLGQVQGGGGFPWDLLIAVVLGGWVGWFLHETIQRWREQQSVAKLQDGLREANRQMSDSLRSLRGQSSDQQKSVSKLENLIAISRRHHESIHQEVVGIQALGKMMEGLVDKLKTVKAGEATQPVPVTPLVVREKGIDPEKLATAEQQLASCLESLQTSQEKLADAEARSQTWELRLESAMHQERQAAKEAERLKADLAASHEALFKCDERVTVREKLIGKLQEKLAEAAQRSAVSHEELDVEARYLTLVAEKDQRITDLEKELETAARAEDPRLVELTREIQRLESELVAAARTEDPRLAEQAQQIAELERQLEAQAADSAPPPSSAPPSAAEPEMDDLRQIRGIGPALERRLHELGITTYFQIAGWDDDEIDRMAKLGRFGDRIRRFDWVQEARNQYFEKAMRS